MHQSRLVPLTGKLGEQKLDRGLPCSAAGLATETMILQAVLVSPCLAY